MEYNLSIHHFDTWKLDVHHFYFPHFFPSLDTGERHDAIPKIIPFILINSITLEMVHNFLFEMGYLNGVYEFFYIIFFKFGDFMCCRRSLEWVNFWLLDVRLYVDFFTIFFCGE